MPETISGSAASASSPQWPSASRVEAMNPTDSSSGVVCALPTTNSPDRSTTNVSVIVPPASIESTRGSLPPDEPRLGSAATETDSKTQCLTLCRADVEKAPASPRAPSEAHLSPPPGTYPPAGSTADDAPSHYQSET